MPYPMPAVTFRDFIDRVTNVYAVTERSLDESLVGPRGDVKVEWLERIGRNGQILKVPRPSLDDDEPIDPWLMGNLCRRLELDPSDFGYHLD